ncbi:MAG: hypothetical protein IPG46_20170 [Actinobacteria bacterium]|nr:hypothetical protein [Actinomycetota bacterium]
MAGCPVGVHVVQPGVLATELFELPDNDPSLSDIEPLPPAAIVDAVLGVPGERRNRSVRAGVVPDLPAVKAGNLRRIPAGAVEYTTGRIETLGIAPPGAAHLGGPVGVGPRRSASSGHGDRTAHTIARLVAALARRLIRLVHDLAVTQLVGKKRQRCERAAPAVPHAGVDVEADPAATSRHRAATGNDSGSRSISRIPASRRARRPPRVLYSGERRWCHSSSAICSSSRGEVGPEATGWAAAEAQVSVHVAVGIGTRSHCRRTPTGRCWRSRA